jgi:ParB family chromosome partitioning protein
MTTKKRRGLGRGLGSLIGDVNNITQPSREERERGLSELPVERIERGRYQPRVHFDQAALEELAESIKAQGVVQPVVVRPVGSGYELLAGERRWRAAQMAGLETIPAVIRELDDQAAAAIGLIENIQREDLNPLEEARALERLIEEFGLTHQEVAQAVGRSRVGVSNLLRLLELNADVKQLVEEGRLEMGHARALLAVKGAQQSALAERVASQGLSVRETEALVRAANEPRAAKAPAAELDPDIRRLQDDLSDRLGAVIRIQHGKDGKGKVVIHYNTTDELDGILAHIQ